MLIEHWFLIISEQIEYDILITKVDQYLNDEVSSLPELLFIESELKSALERTLEISMLTVMCDACVMIFCRLQN